MSKIFVDSVAWISYSVPTDSNHNKARIIFQTLAENVKLYTSLFVIDEIITIVRKKLGQDEADKLYRQINKLEKTNLIILPVEKDDLEKSIELLHKYPTPNTFSLTDATNIVLCLKYKIKTLFSFDSDFKKIKVPDIKIIP